MGAPRQSLQAQLKILKKSSKHQIYQSERKFSQTNYDSYLKSVKEPKIRIGVTRRNLQAQPKMLKKKFGTSNQPINCPGSLKNKRTQVKFRKP
jgi:hypothetical protein